MAADTKTSSHSLPASKHQYEGAVKEDGRGTTIWDVFPNTIGKIADFSNADVAVDQYHLFPVNGTGEINQAGVDHYNNVINALLAEGIEPYVTLFHWDLPQALEDKYNGWLDPQIILDFTTYAETCFEKFGDRVKHWITFNEPHTFATQGYDTGLFAPGRCSILLHLFCKAGNSVTEPYIVGHNILLSHATVADICRTKYKQKQNGSLSVSFDVIWFEPASNSTEDIEATQRAQDFQFGWFIEPLILGDYLSLMIDRVGSRSPRFTEAESALLKGSLDFVGINHYTTYYASQDTLNLTGVLLHDSISDSGAVTLPLKNGKPIGDRLCDLSTILCNISALLQANSIWLYIVPHGIRSLMNYIREKYDNPPVIITENGMDDPNSPLISRKDALKDEKRIKYHRDYLSNLSASIQEDGCNVKGYFVWSLLDSWEWIEGFTSRFGLYFVDYNDNLKRYPKDSVEWFKTFLASEAN